MKFNFVKKSMALLAIVAIVFIQSCNDDPKPVIQPGELGFFVVNEGGFGNGNSSVSFYDRETDIMSNDIFIARNGRALGNQAQSMTVFEGKGYIIVQGDSKIVVINADDFSSVATINEDVPSPRYFLGISTTKAYVSDWGVDGITGTIKVIDLSNYDVIKTISTGQGSNKMVKRGNFVYVVNQGGYGKDNSIEVIDTKTDAVVGEIITGDNPNSLQIDKEGNIWVATSGAKVYKSDWSIDETASTLGSITKIGTDDKVVMSLQIDKVTSSPGNLEISPDKKTLYYTYSGAIYAINITDTTLPVAPLVNKNYYGLSVDPFNGNIIGCLAPNFSAAGSIDVYDASGNFGKSYTVGIGPNGCAFK
jgi:YVTN family beta-propeller protein